MLSARIFASGSAGCPTAALRVVLTLVFALCLALRPALAFDPQAAPTVSAAAYFNAPQDGARDPLLENRLIALIDSVPAGASLRGAFYTWSRQSVARAVVRAHARGVDVRLVLADGNVTGSGREYRAVTRLRNGLGDRLHICTRGDSRSCLGTGIQHNKFLLASELEDGRRHVIWQSSANLTRPQLRAFNDAVILDGDAALFEALLHYWQALHEGRTAPHYRDSATGDALSRVHFFPRARGDTVVEILDRVDCSGGGQIHLAMARFTWPRRAVARRLAGLRAEGCEVAAVLRESHSGQRLRGILEAGDVTLWVFPRGADHAVHSKYLLIDAPISGSPLGPLPVQMVVTGSHNFTGPALRRHDEILFEIPDAGLHAAYLENWTMLRARVAGQKGLPLPEL